MVDIQDIARREAGLPAVLGPFQMAGIAFGVAISYGLISGGVLPLALFGPLAVWGYVAAACVVLLLMRCLAEMVAIRAVPSAFGAYAEAYLGPRLGIAVRTAYFTAVICIVGTEVVLLEPLFGFWLAPIPSWGIAVMLLLGLGVINSMGARASASFGLVLVLLKVGALVALIILAGYQALTAEIAVTRGREAVEFGIGGDLHLSSLGQAFVLATMGFLGIETMAVAAAETLAPARTLQRYMRMATWGILILTLMAVAASAWVQVLHLVPFNVPPFAYLLGMTGLSAVNTVFNALVLLTVVSLLNSQIYAGSRQLFGLLRAARALTRRERNRQYGACGSAVWTALLSVLIYLLYGIFPSQVYIGTTSIAATALLAVWMATFASHIGFRWAAGRQSWPAMTGCGLVLSIAASTLMIDVIRMILPIGGACLLLIFLAESIVFLILKNQNAKN